MEAQLSIDKGQEPTRSRALDPEELLDDLVAFSEFGKQSKLSEICGVPLVVNEFWTSGQRRGHSLHEVSYRACFKPQLPGFFLDRLSVEGDRVHDPFMGRGTTLVEAALRGRSPSGSDINPLSAMLVRPRLRPPTLAQIEQRLKEIDLEDDPGEWREDLLAFFHPKTLRQLMSLRSYFLRKETAGEIDEVDAFIRMVAVNRLTGHSAGFFSVYTLPPNQATSVDRQLAINRKRDQTPPARDVKFLIRKKAKALLRDLTAEERDELLAAEEAKLLVSPAWAAEEIETAEVKLSITSPPFLDIVDYQADNWMRCWFVGIDAAEVQISRLRKVEDWTAMVHTTFKEHERLVAKGGYMCFEVGEVRNGKVCLEEQVIEAAEGTRLQPVVVVVNSQNFTKTSHLWGVKNRSKGTNTNRIVVMRRA